MKILFHGYIYLIDASFFITFDAAISIMLLFFYLNKKKKLGIISFPLKIPYLVYGLSCIIYAIYPSISVGQIQPIFSELIFTYIFFQVLVKKEDFSFTIKYFIIIGYVLMINGIVDWGSHFNPIGEIMEACAGKRYWSSDNTVARFGFERTKSFMPHAIPFGVTCDMLIYLMAFIFLNNINIKYKSSIIFLILLLLVGIILSNSRTPLIALSVGMIAFLGGKLFKGSRGIAILISGAVFFVLFGDYIQHMADSVLHENKVEAEGSSTELREKQLDAALYYYYKNPIFGMGDKFDILKVEEKEDVMGMESVWFGVIYQRGLVGIVSSLFFYLGLFVLLRCGGELYKSVFFFIVMWLCACTFSTLPGLDLGFFLCILILIYKLLSIKVQISTFKHQTI